MIYIYKYNVMIYLPFAKMTVSSNIPSILHQPWHHVIQADLLPFPYEAMALGLWLRGQHLRVDDAWQLLWGEMDIERV